MELITICRSLMKEFRLRANARIRTNFDKPRDFHGKMKRWYLSKIGWFSGFQCMDYSNWTICSPLSHFCFQNFWSFSLSYWGANSYYPREPIIGRGNFSKSRTEWDEGFSVPGAFKLDHFQSIEPILFQQILNFPVSYWEANPYYPRGLIMRKGHSFIQLQNRMR